MSTFILSAAAALASRRLQPRADKELHPVSFTGLHQSSLWQWGDSGLPAVHSKTFLSKLGATHPSQGNAEDMFRARVGVSLSETQVLEHCTFDS